MKQYTLMSTLEESRKRDEEASKYIAKNTIVNTGFIAVVAVLIWLIATI